MCYIDVLEWMNFQGLFVMGLNIYATFAKLFYANIRKVKSSDLVLFRSYANGKIFNFSLTKLDQIFNLKVDFAHLNFELHKGSVEKCIDDYLRFLVDNNNRNQFSYTWLHTKPKHIHYILMRIVYPRGNPKEILCLIS